MGLFKAFSSALRGSMQDQWKEMFYCEAIPSNVLLKKGRKMTSSRSANNGSDNVITDGSIITVADGEAAIIVVNGRVIASYTEPGEHTFSCDKTAGVFSANSIEEAAETVASDVGNRFGFGGIAPVVCRVYYMNTKEIPGNNISLGNAIPFRIYDENTGLDMDISISVEGTYSFKIVDPLIIYKQIIGNIEAEYFTNSITSQINSELATKLQTVLASFSTKQFRVSGIPAIAPVIGEAVKQSINPWLRQQRGIELVSFPISAINVNPADMATVSELQKAEVLKDTAMAGAYLTSATADALRMAASSKGVSDEQ